MAIAERALEQSIENKTNIDDIDTQLHSIKLMIEPLIQNMRTIKWVGGLIVGLVVGLLFAVITGQVSIIFP